MICFGHRGDAGFLNDKYLDDQGNSNRQNGCHYRGVDEPSVIGRPDEKVKKVLNFYAQIIDTCNLGATIKTKTWTVSLQYKVPGVLRTMLGDFWFDPWGGYTGPIPWPPW